MSWGQDEAPWTPVAPCRSPMSERPGPLWRVPHRETLLWAPPRDGVGSSAPVSLGPLGQAMSSSSGSLGRAGEGPAPCPPVPLPHVDSKVLSGNRLWLVGVEK